MRIRSHTQKLERFCTARISDQLLAQSCYTAHTLTKTSKCSHPPRNLWPPGYVINIAQTDKIFCLKREKESCLEIGIKILAILLAVSIRSLFEIHIRSTRRDLGVAEVCVKSQFTMLQICFRYKIDCKTSLEKCRHFGRNTRSTGSR